MNTLPSERRRQFGLLIYFFLLASIHFATAQPAQVSGHASSNAPVFTRVTLVAAATDRANSQGASWVDFDGDDDLDLFVANIGGGGNFLYQNDGEGNLERVTTGPLATDPISSHGVCWADFDNDDDLDVFVSGPNSTMYINKGSGSFAVADLAATFGTTDLRGWSCAWADYDLDGFVDLFITHPAGFVGNPSTSNHFLRNRGDGTMERVASSPATTGFAPYTVVSWSDYDLDGDPDLFIGAGPATGTPGPDFLYQNMKVETGTANLVRITDGPLATRMRDGQIFNWIDYDNDGDLDVYLTNWGGAPGQGGMRDELYRNDDGVLVEITEGRIVTDKQVSLGSTWGDFDNDGDLDTYVSDGNGGGTSRFYDNNGDGTFARLFTNPIISDAGVSWGATAGDYDADGDLDLYVANALNGSVNYLYRNDQATGNHWLRIRTVGTASNRAGVGAILRAKATINGVPTWMMRDVSTQNAFNGHNDLNVHFGLGDAVTVDSLTISWPSGAEDLFVDVDADQLLVATEGEHPSPVANEDDPMAPQEFVLLSNYPNPLVTHTNFVFSIPEAASVRLTIHDPLGRVVATPVAGMRTSGRHEVRFDAEGLSSGPYMYRLEVDGRVFERVMVAIK